ncbi:MAG: hypothetical protein ABWY20_07990 [Mycobacterium sp.]
MAHSNLEEPSTIMLGVTASTSIIVATLLAHPPAVPYRHGVSLLHGWAPPVAQAVTATVLLLAIG